MVRWPAAAEAAAYAREHPSLSLGLHVDLGEKIFRAGEWVPLYAVVPLQDTTAMRDEISRQLDVFHHLMGHDPSHLDSHQHVHLREPVRTILIEMARAPRIPLRHCSSEIGYRGSFYGQTAEGTTLARRDQRRRTDSHSGNVASGLHGAGHAIQRTECDLDTMYRSRASGGTQSLV